MERASLVRGTDGASPLVGLVLMVAITVVFATVLGAFSLGISDHAGASAPDATISFTHDAENETLTVVHDGGSDLPVDRIAFAGDVEGGTEACSDGRWASDGGEIIHGDSCDLPDVAADHNVAVVWVGEDVSATLEEWEGPEA